MRKQQATNKALLLSVAIIVGIILCVNLSVDIMVKIETYKLLRDYEYEYYYQTEVPLENATAEYIAYVEEFFKYNISNAGKKLTLEELKDQGGVCSHYSKLYIDLARADGFDTEYVKFKAGNESHAVAVIANEKGYCIADQRMGWCTNFAFQK